MIVPERVQADPNISTGVRPLQSGGWRCPRPIVSLT